MVEPFTKPAGQSLATWVQATVRDATSAKSFQIGRRPAVAIAYGAQEIVEFVDAGSVVFAVSLYSTRDADLQTGRAILASFAVTGAAHVDPTAIAAEPFVAPSSARAARTSTGGSRGMAATAGAWPGLNLPLKVDYAWYDASNGGWMSAIAVTAGGVNSWLDHNQPNHTCDGTLTRYDGQILTGGCGTNCTLSVSCYDGHEGIDFSTDGQTGIPVYAADAGTATTFSDSVCGTAVDIASSGKPGITTRYCHLSGYVSGIATGVTVAQGQEIGLSGCTGNCSGPHLHFQVNNTNNASGQPQPIDPNGWTGGGADPWPYDLGYLWSTPTPSFVGRTLYSTSPALSGGWTAYTDHYGVASWYATTTTRTASATATWKAPAGLACYGVEVWISTDHGTATSASYKLAFGDGAASQSVTVNQNANTAWYTISQGSHPVSTVTLGNNTGVRGQQVAAAQVWYSC
jgi:murein DD-endopeptidase MepM/ murein hydrolase activator NlpD